MSKVYGKLKVNKETKSYGWENQMFPFRSQFFQGISDGQTDKLSDAHAENFSLGENALQSISDDRHRKNEFKIHAH